MFLKIVAFFAILFVIYLLFFKKSRNENIKKNDKLISDEMVECPTCKTFVSQNEAIVSNGRFYCSKECLNKKSYK